MIGAGHNVQPNRVSPATLPAIGRCVPDRIASAFRGIMRRAAVGETPTAGMVRMIALLSGVAGVLIATALPVAWFLAAQAGLRGELRGRAEVYAFQVQREASQNPVLWNALAGSAKSGVEGLEIVPRPDGSEQDNAERRRVLSGDGEILIDVSPLARLAWPELTVRLPVMDGATRLGDVEVARSLRPALFATVAVAALSVGLGLLIFLLLRVVPLRMLHVAIGHAAFASAHDQLTGLPNRRLFHDRLEQALATARRGGGQVALFYMDLDHFKDINDLLGHPAGDATLRIVAERLRSCLRESDTLARLGGDEFAVIQPEFHRLEDANTLGRRLLAAIEPTFDLDGQIRSVGLSVGVAVSDIGAPTVAEQMMKHADMALYRAKEEGRRRVCFYTPDMDETLRERHAMEVDLRTAIAGRGLTVHYQPQVDLASGRIIGAEALLRWDRPGHGMVEPDRFIPLAENTGLISQLGLWVLRDACRRAVTWPEELGVAVNVSPVQFRDPGFCQAIIDTIRDSGISPQRVELEITEGVLMQDTVETLRILRQLRDFGTRLAVDDFGTGYSSLGYLSKFRFDKIKIDRTFTSRICEDSDALAIVRAVVGLTDALGGITNAEGVETSAQAGLLRAEGCSEAQGYLFGRPIAGDVFDLLIARRTAVTFEEEVRGPALDIVSA